MPLRKILSNFFSVMHIQFSCGSRQSRAAAKTFCPIFFSVLWTFSFHGAAVPLGYETHFVQFFSVSWTCGFHGAPTGPPGYEKHILCNGHVVFMGGHSPAAECGATPKF